jgi:hypothetical protein
MRDLDGNTDGLAHPLRLGAEMRKINALCRQGGLIERARRRVAVTAVAILGVFPAAECFIILTNEVVEHLQMP